MLTANKKNLSEGFRLKTLYSYQIASRINIVPLFQISKGVFICKIVVTNHSNLCFRNGYLSRLMTDTRLVSDLIPVRFAGYVLNYLGQDSYRLLSVLTSELGFVLLNPAGVIAPQHVVFVTSLDAIKNCEELTNWLYLISGEGGEAFEPLIFEQPEENICTDFDFKCALATANAYKTFNGDFLTSSDEIFRSAAWWL